MVAVATYGKAKQSWLEMFLALPNGIPSQQLEETTIQPMQLIQFPDYSNGVGITFSASKTGITHKILIWILSIMSS